MNQKTDGAPSADLMTAISITRPGGPDVLQPVQCAVPRPADREILIEVAAAGVNRPDVLQRLGEYPAPPDASPLPGLEVAGRIVATGRGVERFALGETVMSLVSGGGYAQYCLAPESSAMRVPAGLLLIEAAAIPEAYMTVWHNLFERGGLRPGETVLIHGGSSGIGTTAIQLAAALGSKVIATAGTQAKCDACRRLGAELAINYRTDDFVAKVKEHTGGLGAHVILDMVGGDYLERNYDAAATDGRIVQIAFLNGSKAMVDVVQLMRKRLHHTGSTLRPRSVEDKGAIVAALELHVLPLLREGRVRPLIDSTFPMSAAADAHARMESGANIGKIVLLA